MGQNYRVWKIYPRVKEFLVKAGGPASAAEIQIERHKNVKNILSAHVHASQATTFRATCTPSLIRPDSVDLDSLGHPSIHMPGLCTLIAEQTDIFGGAIFNILFVCQKDIPIAIGGYKTGKDMQAAFASVYVLQSLLNKYGDDLEREIDNYFSYFLVSNE